MNTEAALDRIIHFLSEFEEEEQARFGQQSFRCPARKTTGHYLFFPQTFDVFSGRTLRLVASQTINSP